MAEKLMLDSNMFDEVVDGNIDLSLFEEYEAMFYVTPIQRTELKKADKPRAEKLMDVFNAVADDEKPSVFSYDMEGAGYDEGAYSSETQREAMDAIREEHAPNEAEDVNMAAVAISAGITFVTDDHRLQNALGETYPNFYLDRDDFISVLNEE